VMAARLCDARLQNGLKNCRRPCERSRTGGCPCRDSNYMTDRRPEQQRAKRAWFCCASDGRPMSLILD
jgi:hypothetical protein